MTTPQWNGSAVDDVEATANSTEIEKGKHYRISANVDLWFVRQAADGEAPEAGDAGTHFLGARASELIYCAQEGQALFYVLDGEDEGLISISEVEV